MSDVLSFSEIDGAHVELLPARTVLSLVGGETDPGLAGGEAKTGDGGWGGWGGDAKGGDGGHGGDVDLEVKDNYVSGYQDNVAYAGDGGAGGYADASADGGDTGDAKGGDADAKPEAPKK